MRLTQGAVKRSFTGKVLECQERNVPGSGLPTVKKILLVGALLEGEKLSFNDQVFLDGTLRFLVDHKIPVDPEYEVEFVNLKQGEDFLSGNFKADVVVACHVFNPPNDGPGGGFFPGADESVFFISEKHHLQNAWHDAAVKSGARIICAYGQNHMPCGERTEITADDFTGQKFCVIDYKDDNLSIAMDPILAAQLDFKVSSMTPEDLAACILDGGA
jgi:hypothetical protein